MGPLLGSFRDWAETPEEWLYTVLACPLIGALRSVPFRSVPFRSARNQRWRRGFPLAGLHVPVFKSAFLPCHRVKMDIPTPRGILWEPTSDERSRSPLSIGALRSARNERIRQVAIFVRKPIADFPVRAALSRAWSRMTGGGNSLKRGEENFASRKVCVKQYDKSQFFSSNDLPASGLGDFRL